MPVSKTGTICGQNHRSPLVQRTGKRNDAEQQATSIVILENVHGLDTHKHGITDCSADPAKREYQALSPSALPSSCIQEVQHPEANSQEASGATLKEITALKAKAVLSSLSKQHFEQVSCYWY